MGPLNVNFAAKKAKIRSDILSASFLAYAVLRRLKGQSIKGIDAAPSIDWTDQCL